MRALRLSNHRTTKKSGGMKAIILTLRASRANILTRSIILHAPLLPFTRGGTTKAAKWLITSERSLG
eukprot:751534-Hanusia_phi.AAC.2